MARSQLDRDLVDRRIARHCDLDAFRAALLALVEPEEAP